MMFADTTLICQPRMVDSHAVSACESQRHNYMSASGVLKVLDVVRQQLEQGNVFGATELVDTLCLCLQQDVALVERENLFVGGLNDDDD